MVLVLKSIDERRLRLPDAPVVMEHDNNRNHRAIYIHISKQIQHNPYISTYLHIHIFTYEPLRREYQYVTIGPVVICHLRQCEP